MGASVSLIGLRDISDKSKFDKMVKVKESCDEAGISYPQQIKEYFGRALDLDDFEDGIEQELLTVNVPNRDWTDNEVSDGFEVDVKDIPSEVKTLRFSVSY